MCKNTGGNLIFFSVAEKMEGRYYLVFIFSIIHVVQAQQGNHILCIVTLLFMFCLFSV